MEMTNNYNSIARIYLGAECCYNANMSQEKIQFRINEQKAVEAVLYIVEKCPGVTMYPVLKALFEADKIHLNQHARPVTGDRYYHLPYGTVPTVIYDLLKGKKDRVSVDVPFMKDAQEVVHVERESDKSLFSKSDLKALDAGIQKYCIDTKGDFRTIHDINHQEPSWNQTPLGAAIDFELMIDDEEIIEYLRENSRSIVI